ncbi:MAG: HypC/HybG/HupF family hydrogenase formation chaperone [Candidatus Omnitrophota bacterium]
MCLAVPGLVKEVLTGNVARVSFMGVDKEVAIDLLEDVLPGQYVIVHAGFAINKLNEEDACDALKEFEQFI